MGRLIIKNKFISPILVPNHLKNYLKGDRG